ncbi:MAG TPA: 2-phosphosulfolactate phosphatase [Caulifigura sp.]|nr:2-phosphosulfolactate phosphatase [Caulifigura sp.]
MLPVRVALLPSTIRQVDLAGSTAVVIDVLRATTTIVHALAAGASAVIPCSEVEQAFAVREQLGRGNCVLGGERHGLLIEGFDLDNSPFRYTAETVGGKTLVFTTTNGTRALAAASSASQVLVGAFVNRAAIVDRLRSEGRPVWIVCAGTDGGVTAEDVLVAGGIAAGLLGRESSPASGLSVEQIEKLSADDANALEIVIAFYLGQGRQDQSRLDAMRASRGGLNLIENGFDRDIARAAEDSVAGLNVVPVFRDGRITLG